MLRESNLLVSSLTTGKKDTDFEDRHAPSKWDRVQVLNLECKDFLGLCVVECQLQDITVLSLSKDEEEPFGLVNSMGCDDDLSISPKSPGELAMQFDLLRVTSVVRTRFSKDNDTSWSILAVLPERN